MGSQLVQFFYDTTQIPGFGKLLESSTAIDYTPTTTNALLKEFFFKPNFFFFPLQGDLKEKQREKELAEEENFGNSTFGQIRTWLWNVMEYPWTSKIAQVRLFLD